MKEALDHLEQFLSIMEECDLFAESSSKVQYIELLIGVQLAMYTCVNRR
jgi:hypothetical protein